jgi:N-formylmaleamate deformylase
LDTLRLSQISLFIIGVKFMTFLTPAYTSNDARVNGINLHYYRSMPGANGPTIILVHGLTDNGLCWVQMADALRACYNLIMPDLRGHGLSDKPEEGYKIETLAADIAGLIDALSLDRPALMGQSLGGLVVMATSAFFPDKMRCAILEEPALAPRDETPEERAARTQQWHDEFTFYQSLSREALMANVRQEHPEWHADLIGPTSDAKLQMSVNAMLKIGSENRWGSWRQAIPKISCPILLLASEPARGGMITPELLQEVKGLWLNGRAVQFHGAGHTLHQELFEPCLLAVNEFLDEIYAKPS